MYCENCMKIIEGERCPECGNKKIRTPEAKDPCFLTETDYLSSGILEDMLKQNGIRYLKKEVMGAGMAIRVGRMLDRSRFYVAYDQLQEAETLAEDLFADADEPAESITE